MRTRYHGIFRPDWLTRKRPPWLRTGSTAAVPRVVLGRTGLPRALSVPHRIVVPVEPGPTPRWLGSLRVRRAALGRGVRTAPAQRAITCALPVRLARPWVRPAPPAVRSVRLGRTRPQPARARAWRAALGPGPSQPACRPALSPAILAATRWAARPIVWRVPAALGTLSRGRPSAMARAVRAATSLARGSPVGRPAPCVRLAGTPLLAARARVPCAVLGPTTRSQVERSVTNCALLDVIAPGWALLNVCPFVRSGRTGPYRELPALRLAVYRATKVPSRTVKDRFSVRVVQVGSTALGMEPPCARPVRLGGFQPAPPPWFAPSAVRARTQPWKAPTAPPTACSAVSTRTVPVLARMPAWAAPLGFMLDFRG